MIKFSLKNSGIFFILFLYFLFSFSATNFTQQIYFAKTVETFNTAAPIAAVLVNPNGTKVEIGISENSLSQNTNLAMIIYSLPKDSVIPIAPIPSDKKAVDIVYNISFFDANTGDSVPALDTAVALTFTYTDADVVGIDESTLTAYHWHNGAWVPLDGNVVDPVANTITARIHDFSFFALIGSPPAESAPAPTPAPEVSTSTGGGGPISHSTNSTKKSSSEKQQNVVIKGDLNGDNKVNLIDFSILYYRYRHGDKKITLADFSIMAYYWTDKYYKK